MSDGILGALQALWTKVRALEAAQPPKPFWGTVLETFPDLRVADDVGDPIPITPYNMAGALNVGDRVRVQVIDRRLYILGRAGGPPPITWDLVDGKPTTFPPTAHTHTISNITGLAAQLAPMPTAAAGGRVTTSASGEITVTYPSGRFTSTPRIATTVVTGGLVAVTHIRSPSSTSFTVSAWALNTLTRIAVNVDWVAIQP